MDISSATEWLARWAVVLVAVSVTATITWEQINLRARPQRARDGDAASVTGGVAYLVTKAVVAKGLVFAVALHIYTHRIFDIDWKNPAVWVGVFVARDFVYYWIHRAEHRVRILWASHMIHHSIDRFSFTAAVRLPWMESLYKPVLWLWAPAIGFHPAAFAAIGALVLAAGQLQHTEHFRRRTILDQVFVTPSAHRVHHGANTRYLDRNFGSMLIIWDRLFRTYTPETEPVTYGLTGDKQLATATEMLTGGYPTLLRDTAHAAGLRAKARCLLTAP